MPPPASAARCWTSPDAGTSRPGRSPLRCLAATAPGDEVVVSNGTYAIASTINLTQAITLRGVSAVPSDVTLDGAGQQAASPLVKFSNSGATVAGLRVYRGGSNNSSGGAVWMASGGTLTNCIVDASQVTGNANITGIGVYINGGGLVTGCTIKNSAARLTGANTAVGVYIADGTLERSLVTGCYRSDYEDSINTLGVVYLAKGTVKNCTIAGNRVSHYPLYVADSATCIVKDSIVWGNVALRDSSDGRPNVRIGANAQVTNLCTTGSFGTSPVNANPCFTDAANRDFTLMPGSPCIGAGTDGGDLGYQPFDTARKALGVKASAYSGSDSLAATVTLTANGYDLTGATVTWEGLAETGTSFTHTFDPGTHTLKANVTLADNTTLTSTLTDAIRVWSTAPMYVDDDSVNPVSPYSSPATAAKTIDAALALAGEGSTIYVTNGTYTLTKDYNILDAIKIIGNGEHAQTVFKAASNCRFFYLGHAGALVSGLYMTGGKAARTGGGIYIAGNGGTVSNCTINASKTDANVADGGGLRLASVNAVCTHSCIMNCGNTVGYGHGAGVYIDNGTLADCLVISNKPSTYAGTNARGGGVYLAASTPNAKVVNCTIAANTAYEGGGLYRTANAGYVLNTLAFGNTSTSGENNLISAGGATRPDATSFSNCCSSVAIGANGQVVTAAPYELPTYALSGTAGAKCIDMGCNDHVVSTKDYLGQTRIFNNTVDIGAMEYCVAAVVPGFLADVREAAGEYEFTLTASVQGAGIGQCICTWYFDGLTEAAGTGAVFKKTLGVGRHSVKLVVSYSGADYTHEEPAYLTVYPIDAYADITSTGAQWPYDSPAKAASNLNAAVNEVLKPGVTLHVAAGRYPITSTIYVGDGRRLIGAGMDATCIYANRDRQVMVINGTDAYVEGVCVSNGSARGGGVYIYGDGGTFTRGKVADCQGAPNQSGGGALITGSKSKISKSVIVGNRTFSYTGAGDSVGTDNSGGGVEIDDSAILENSLVISNKAKNAGGVLVMGSGKVRNCTIVGNSTGTIDHGLREGCGGVSVRSGSVVNCIIRNNVDAVVTDPTSLYHNVVGQTASCANCCVPVSCGSNCVTNDPCFKNPAVGDYRLRGTSPCRDAGVYQSWMEGETDFFGNPRSYNAKRCDIGFHQSPRQGTLMYIR